MFEDAAYRCDVGPHLLEIKSTRTGGVRLTPMQAERASIEKDRYTLCVVDLRGISEEELDAQWTGTRVEPLAKVVPDIGDKVQETCILVEAATTTSIAIRNESALRYEVPSAVWEAGLSIGDWIAQTFAAT